MSDKQNSLLWGLALIILGVIFLVQSAGIVPDLSPIFWAVSFGVASLLFVALYVFGGWRHWGWLFPAFVSGGLAAAAAFAYFEIPGTFIGAVFMATISAPFWIVFLLNRQENWWALIPGWVFGVLAVIVLISGLVAGEIIGALVMWSIALPFFVVYLKNREHWWALIPAFIMTGMGLVVWLSSQNAEAIIGMFMMLVMAVPFLAVYFFVKGQWWAIIPAGIFITLALIIPFADRIEGDTFAARLIAVVMLLGFSLPFAWLWWRQDVYPTHWAKYPAGGLLAAAVFTLILGSFVESAWPVALIVIGLWLLYDNMHQPKLKS